jgi:aspartate oxidase
VCHTVDVGTTWTPRALVVGSGLAGLECALELANEGWRVEVFSPGRAGCDGATHRVHALAPWILLTAPWVRGDSPERFLADLKRRGEGREREGLAEVLATEAHSAARGLIENLGLVPQGEPTVLPGDEFARGMRCLPYAGRALLAPLLEKCKEAGVRVYGRSLVVGLLAAGGRVTGTVVIDRTSHVTREGQSDAVVLACGGVGAIFPTTTAPRWNRGSGLALGSAAGALLHCPEVTQALPVTATPPLYFPTSAALLSSRIGASDGASVSASDLGAVTEEIGQALRRGAAVFMEPKGDGAHLLPPRIRESAAFRAEGRVPLTLALHHGIGGVAIDSWGRTSLPGLYACGEAAGGVQGLRRTMGTGLLEATIFARRAARAACHDIARLGPAPSRGEVRMPPIPLDPARFEERLDELMGPLVALRPAAAVDSALREIERWPVGVEACMEEEGALAGIRRLGAIAILAGEQSRSGGGGNVVGLPGNPPRHEEGAWRRKPST